MRRLKANKYYNNTYMSEVDRLSRDYMPKSTKNSSRRPKSCFQKKLPYVNNNDNSFFSTKSVTKYKIENEALYEQTMQLRTTLAKMKSEYKDLLEESSKKESLLKKRDKEIANMIEKNRDDLDEGGNTNLLGKINDQIDILQGEITALQNNNNLLKQNFKITKMNELEIEEEIFKTEIDKISTLFNCSLHTKEGIDKQKEEYSVLRENIDRQEIIMKSLLGKLNECKQNEAEILTEIKNVQRENENTKRKSQKINLEVTKLFNKNDNLNNDSIIHPKRYSMTEGEFLQEITKIKKDKSYYTALIKSSDSTIKDLTTQKEKLEDLLKAKDNQYEFAHPDKYIPKRKSVMNPANYIGDEPEKIQILKDKLKRSKEAEVEKEKELRNYQVKIDQVLANQEQGEEQEEQEIPVNEIQEVA